MKRKLQFYIIPILVLFPAIGFYSFKHPFYLSVVDLKYNNKEQLMQGSIKVFVNDFEDALTKLALPGQKTWNDDAIKKRQLIQNVQNIGMVDTVFE